MGVTTTKTNKPFNPRGNDASPLAYNKAAIYSGKALDFDGVNDYIDLGTEENTNLVSYSFYLNLHSYSIGSGIIGRNAGNGDNYVQIWISGNAIKFFVGSGSDNESIQTTTPKVGEWIHCVYVVDGTNKTQKVYFNGILDLENTFTLSLDTTNRALQIGALQQTAYSFDGQIAGFKAFSTALTPAQIADLYNNPEKIVPTGVANTALKLWLPMQEGAGTTAYDGSGNGNHGTISGATYVNGVGAPVAQTAVIDWNKGTNYVKHSENIVTGWTLQNVAASINSLEAPDGLTTATKFTASAVDIFHLNNFTYASASAGIWKESVFAKAGEVDFAYLVIRVNNGSDRYGVKFDLTDGTFVDDITTGSPTNTGYEITDAGNGWYKCTIQALHTSGNITNVLGPNIAGNLVDINGNHQGDGVSGMYMWGASLQPSTAGDSYIRTGATAQTSPVLLPQGLTTGRDITGVNLFENVRKQGALNLDGNSWAEVHDNASLNYSSNVTLEAWIYWTADDDKGILGRWNGPAIKRSLMLYATSATKIVGIYSSNGSSTSGSLTPSQNLVAGNWYHVAFTSDGSTIKIYINGVEGNSASYSSGFYVSDENVEIATYQNDQAKSHTGQLAQPRIYNRALTAEEVQRNYDAGKNTYTN